LNLQFGYKFYMCRVGLMVKKRYRIHPAVACVAMVCLTVLAVVAQFHGQDSALKIAVASIISWILGVKLRRKLPIT